MNTLFVMKSEAPLKTVDLYLQDAPATGGPAPADPY